MSLQDIQRKNRKNAIVIAVMAFAVVALSLVCLLWDPPA